MNKQGGILDVIIWIIISFVTLVFFAMWTYMHGILTATMSQIPSTETINFTEITRVTLGRVDSALGQLETIGFIIIIVLALSILVTAYFSGANPIVFVIHIFTTVLAIVFSVIISNTYEKLLINSVIGENLAKFDAGTFIMLNLPTFAAVLGIMGIVFGIVGILRHQSRGGVGL